MTQLFSQPLSGKVVVITGAAAGVGRATVREFASKGASIGLVARDPESLQAAKKEAEELGGHALVIPTDVAEPELVEAAALKVEEAFGPIDIWINVAMVSVFSPVKEMRPEEYRRVTEVSYLGYVYGTLSALKRMLPRNKGVIIQVGSALAYRSIPLQSAYCGAKHAIEGFTESLRSELLHDRSKVRVTMVELPAVNTTQFGWVKSRLSHKARPVAPVFQPEVIARGIYFAATHNRRDLKIGFSTLKAMFAEKLAPGFADHYLARTAYKGQQTDEPEVPGRPDNLWQAVPGDRGAHGSFDAEARSFSYQLWATENRGLLLSAGAALGTAFLLSAFTRFRGSRKGPSHGGEPEARLGRAS